MNFQPLGMNPPFFGKITRKNSPSFRYVLLPKAPELKPSPRCSHPPALGSAGQQATAPSLGEPSGDGEEGFFLGKTFLKGKEKCFGEELEGPKVGIFGWIGMDL